jgi:hypothetical protein
MAITLSEEAHAAIYDLADALGKPASKVAAELLQEMVPQLQGLAKISRASKAGNKAAAKRALQHMLGDSLAELMADQQPELFGKGKGSKS